MTSGTGCSRLSRPGSVTRRRCWTVSCRRRSPTTRQGPGSTCSPAAARSGLGATARTTLTRASTRQRPATSSPMRSTPTRSPSSSSAAGPAIRCWPESGPAGAAQRPAPGVRRMTAARRSRPETPPSRPKTRAWTPGSAFRTPVPWVPIPAVPLPPRRPGAPAALPVDPPPWRPGLREDLVELAADAASRAWELATGLSADAGLTLAPDDDLARRAARVLGTPAFATLAARSGVPPRDLARQALAWRQGGLSGLELLRTEWDPAAEDPDTAGLLDAARAVLRARTGAAEAVRGNRITAGRLQLRLGRDLRWYPVRTIGPGLGAQRLPRCRSGPGPGGPLRRGPPAVCLALPLRPRGDDAVDGLPDQIAGFGPAGAGHQQGVVVGVFVTDRRHHRQREGLLIE